jgi:hypothetical protein
LLKRNCCHAGEGNPPCYIHRDGHVIVAGGNNHWTKLGQMETFHEHVLQKEARKAAEAEGLIGKDLDEAVSIANQDCYSVHRSQEYRRRFISASASAQQITAAAKKGAVLSSVYVPGKLTGRYQLADVVINKPFCGFVQSRYQQHQQQTVLDGLEAGLPLEDIDISNRSIVDMAPLLMTWIGLRRLMTEQDPVRPRCLEIHVVPTRLF